MTETITIQSDTDPDTLDTFSYEEFWEDDTDGEADLCIYHIPTSPALTKLSHALHRLENSYNLKELEEEGIDVREMLNHMTEQEVLEKLEEAGIEPAITFGEIQGLRVCEEFQEILQLPKVKKEYIDLRQIEEILPGIFADVSVFATTDYLCGVKEFNKYRYFTDKVAERAKDLAIMHSCITDEQGKNEIKQRFIALVNTKHRNYALKLLAIHNTTSDEEKRAELRVKLLKQSRQIRRLKEIWLKYAYSE